MSVILILYLSINYSAYILCFTCCYSRISITSTSANCFSNTYAVRVKTLVQVLLTQLILLHKFWPGESIKTSRVLSPMRPAW